MNAPRQVTKIYPDQRPLRQFGIHVSPLRQPATLQCQCSEISATKWLHYYARRF